MSRKRFPNTLNSNDPEAVYRFIGGRNHYNARRTLMASIRRLEVSRLLLQGFSQSDIARKLNIHPSTISRDVKRLYLESNKNRICPYCRRQI